MKKVIKAARFGGYKYRYEIHRMNPSGSDILLGGSHNLQDAEQTALNQLVDIFDNPWESPQRKILMIQNLYIYDSELDQDVTTGAVGDAIDQYIEELSNEF